VPTSADASILTSAGELILPTDHPGQGVVFTAEQRRWLDAIKDHIAKSLRIDEEDFDEVPFNTIGGLGRGHDLFGERLPEILDELNRRLAA
jgi:type I restriction enzyme R subunit